MENVLLEPVQEPEADIEFDDFVIEEIEQKLAPSGLAGVFILSYED